jgi:hypothetical protein
VIRELILVLNPIARFRFQLLNEIFLLPC